MFDLNSLKIINSLSFKPYEIGMSDLPLNLYKRTNL